MDPIPQQAQGKALAGAEAASLVSSGMRLGLGTGSTVAFFLKALAERYRNGDLHDIVGVPTSVRTQEEAGDLGIPLADLEAVESLDLTVDGADEVDPHFDLIKGLGGALLREKMVAQATRTFVIIVDESKIVPRLGTRSPLPVEVVPFSWESHLPFLEGLGCTPVLREEGQGRPMKTDNGNFILDCRFSDGIGDPEALDLALSRRAGIVESGLFLGLASRVLVGGSATVETLIKPDGQTHE